jgi:hypothetical protein
MNEEISHAIFLLMKSEKLTEQRFSSNRSKNFKVGIFHVTPSNNSIKFQIITKFYKNCKYLEANKYTTK